MGACVKIPRDRCSLVVQRVKELALSPLWLGLLLWQGIPLVQELPLAVGLAKKKKKKKIPRADVESLGGALRKETGTGPGGGGLKASHRGPSIDLIQCPH